MTQLTSIALLSAVLCTACGGDSSPIEVPDAAPAAFDAALPPDARLPALDCGSIPSPTVASEQIIVSGTTIGLSVGNVANVPNAIVSVRDENDPDGETLAQGQSDAQGAFSFTIDTETMPLNAFVAANAIGRIPTEVFFSDVLAADQVTPTALFDSSTLALLGAAAGQTQVEGNAIAVVLVIDCEQQRIAGATVTAPSGTVVYAGANGQPDQNATTTTEAGLAFVFNVTPGTDLVFDAEVAGTSMRDNTVRAVADIVLSMAIAP